MDRTVAEWDETDLMKAVYGLRQRGLLTRAACSQMIQMILDGTSAVTEKFGREFGRSPAADNPDWGAPNNH